MYFRKGERNMDKQTVMVTGSSSGFGFLLTQGLLAQEYTVFATMRDLDGKNAAQAAKLRQYAQGQHGVLHLVELDVTEETSVVAAVENVLQQAGNIDVVVNNAGGGGRGYTEAFSVEQFQKMFDVNVFGVQRVMRAVLPSMRAHRSGLIITISSAQGRMVVPFSGTYTASKFAVEGLAESYHYDLAPLGVDVVIVEPGAFGTGFWSKMTGPDDQARVSGYAPAVDLPDKVWDGVFANLQGKQAPDPQVLVSAIIKLIETPAGKRPLRTVVDPMMGGGFPTAVNQTTESVQRELLEALGLEDRISVQSEREDIR
jgi:NAD(P)-dependent dehydrogenase (short-subunit alcohol dehydrogenase family)